MKSPSDDRAYYAARAECARRLERAAAAPMIAVLHAQMADHYEQLVTTLGSNRDDRADGDHIAA